MRSTPKLSTVVARIAARSSAAARVDRGHGARRRRRRGSRSAVLDQLGHRAALEGDHGRAARHRLDDAVAERLVEVDQVQQGVRAAEQLGSLVRADRAEERDALAVESRRAPLVEVALVLDDPGDHEPHPGRDGDVDRLGRSLVGMDPAEEQQVVARRRGAAANASVSMP